MVFITPVLCLCLLCSFPVYVGKIFGHIPFALLITISFISPVCVRGREIAWDIVFVWKQKNAAWLIAFGRLWCNVSARRLSAQDLFAFIVFLETVYLSVFHSLSLRAGLARSVLSRGFVEQIGERYFSQTRRRKQRDLGVDWGVHFPYYKNGTFSQACTKHTPRKAYHPLFSRTTTWTHTFYSPRSD